MKVISTDPNSSDPLGIGGLYDDVGVDPATRAILVNDRVKDPLTDGIEAVTPCPDPVQTLAPVTSTSTTYVPSTEILDMANFDRLMVLPNQTTGAVVGNGVYKLEWSPDRTNWFGDPANWNEFNADLGAIATGERPATVNIVTHSWSANAAAAFHPEATYVRQKQARWCRISQKSSAAVTITTSYLVQRL